MRNFSVASVARRLQRFGYFLQERWYFWRHPDHPWLAPGAIRWLEEYLGREKAAGRTRVAYEFGSGRSTYFFAPYFQRYFSVEHDAEWAARVESELTKRRLSHVDLVHIPPGARGPAPIRRNSFWDQLGYEARRPKFQRYFESVLDRCGDTQLDFALVDGRARVACFLNTLPRIRSGGVLIFDNFDRPEYQVVLPLMVSWKDYSFRTGLFETRIFVAP